MYLPVSQADSVDVWAALVPMQLDSGDRLKKLKALFSLLIFCLGDPSIAESGVLRSSTISVLLSLCLFILVKSWLVYLAAPVLVT